MHNFLLLSVETECGDLRVWGLGFRVWGLGFRVWGLGFGVVRLVGQQGDIFGSRLVGFRVRDKNARLAAS